jgi:hypothetical protein
VVDIDLIGRGKVKFFTFFVPVPGIKTDFQEVDFDNLHSADEMVDLDDMQ